MPTELQIAAVEYLGVGLHILALTGKKPNGRVHGENWSYEDSFHGQPLGVEEVHEVWRAFSPTTGTTGIAILIPPDMLVADVDTDRAAALLLDLGFVTDEETVAAKTKNGLHIWFWLPGADRNRWLGDGQQPDPGRTLLFKGLGGYVVAPPSAHLAADGSVDGTYEWVSPLAVGGMIQMPNILPPGAIERLKRNDLWDADRNDRKDPVTSFHLVPGDGPWWTWEKVWTYQTEGLERAIINAADGNQNNLIHWAAMTAREEGVPYEVAMTRLLDAAIKGGHPKNRARDTIRGAYKRAPRA
jgi:hypothetical protein